MAQYWWHLRCTEDKKVAEELKQADVEGGGGWERWSEDTLPLPGAEEAETQMSENKNSPERGGQNVLISQLCTVKHSSCELECLIGSVH